MFYFLSKAIDFIVMPFSIIFFMLAYAFFTKSNQRRRLVLGLATVSLYLMSNSYLVMKALNAWEYRLINISQVKKTYDVGILLSGGLTLNSTPRQYNAAMGDHGDRVLQAFQLYKSGKIKKILITGRSSPEFMAIGRGETRQAASLLVSWGIPAQNIIFEERARNTRENAVFSARILKKMFPDGEYLLITSAFHMRRSAGCFEKAGIKTHQFPADFHGGYNKMVLQKLIPDPDAFAYFCSLWHEVVGYIAYKAMGYC